MRSSQQKNSYQPEKGIGRLTLAAALLLVGAALGAPSISAQAAFSPENALSFTRLTAEADRPDPERVLLNVRLLGARAADSPEDHFVLPVRSESFVQAVYSGIDLRTRTLDDGHQVLEFAVTPGFDPSVIEFEFECSEDIVPSLNGDLQIQIESSHRRWHAPAAFQVSPQGKTQVPVWYEISREGKVGLAFGDFDRGLPLLLRIPFEASSLLIRNQSSTD